MLFKYLVKDKSTYVQNFGREEIKVYMKKNYILIAVNDIAVQICRHIFQIISININYEF
jgi:hypothetical protein